MDHITTSRTKGCIPSSRKDTQTLSRQTRIYITGDKMKPPFGIGDLVRLSFRGKLSLVDVFRPRSVGIVTRTNPNHAIQLCSVQWANEPEPVEMHWGLIELVD